MARRNNDSQSTRALLAAAVQRAYIPVQCRSTDRGRPQRRGLPSQPTKKPARLELELGNLVSSRVKRRGRRSSSDHQTRELHACCQEGAGAKLWWRRLASALVNGGDKLTLQTYAGRMRKKPSKRFVLSAKVSLHILSGGGPFDGKPAEAPPFLEQAPGELRLVLSVPATILCGCRNQVTVGNERHPCGRSQMLSTVRGALS